MIQYRSLERNFVTPTVLTTSRSHLPFLLSALSLVALPSCHLPKFLRSAAQGQVQKRHPTEQTPCRHPLCGARLRLTLHGFHHLSFKDRVTFINYRHERHKIFLHQFCQKNKVDPTFEVRPTGPKHRQRFLCEVRVAGYNYVGAGNSTNKKDAQANAAKDFVSFLVRQGLINSAEVPVDIDAAPAPVIHNGPQEADK
ncbi:hypothetical protein NQ317_003741 [Molorchus minor]|uniref:DRBM domain-containing protein n=1 Tax=Molorchus minor TaxID=1323400 RepID=A0ABQ9JQG4_9CUCU|nr:hypothetical protein NQ317_003741 [Molorchus minor]